MKLNITRSDGTVRFVFDTKYITYPLLFIFIFPISFYAVFVFEIPPLFYDIALGVLITLKTLRIISTRRKRKR